MIQMTLALVLQKIGSLYWLHVDLIAIFNNSNSYYNYYCNRAGIIVISEACSVLYYYVYKRISHLGLQDFVKINFYFLWSKQTLNKDNQ